jgi:tetratricopeptide (TPR) repeat protein
MLAATAPVTQPAGAALPLGHISFPTSGPAVAQGDFVRGVLLLHSFEYDSAIDAFRQAEQAAPGFAMAFWGEALAYNQPLWYNENLDKARAALNRLAPSRAARQATAPTAREKAYLDAVEHLYGEGDKKARDRAYSDAMAAVHRQYPEDDEASVLYALSLLATIPSGERNTTVSLQAGNIALAVLKRNPEHPGAAHYALHAFDDGEHAAMGLQAARTYARFAPASSHARHMPSHVFLPLGMWDEAVASDESAFAASVAIAKQKGLSAAQYDFHSLSWLQYEYLQQGRFTKAREAMKTVEAALHASNLSNPSNHHESEIGRGFGETSLKSELASMKARLVIESADWALMKGQGSFDNIDELFALGVASVPLNDPGRASAAFDNLGQAAKSVPDADAREIARIMAAELDGLMRLARNDRPGALAALANAAQLEARRPRPIARPYPIKPAGELYAEILLGTGDISGALAQYKATLARTPRRAQSLLGLARAEEAAGHHAEAVKTAKDFLAAWHLADKDRAELAEMRALTGSPK